VQRICVFCGANVGARPAYAAAAEELARLLVADGIGVVYGGTEVGLMGRLADAELRVVGSMHERKALMAELSDAFVALPGGIGTLEELFEVYTWSQLGLHRKPCGLLDVEGYYGGVEAFLEHAVEERFLREEHRAMLMVEEDPRTLLDRLRDWEPGVATPKWIGREET
jgi:predicted Rossmann-fold nucleotide-binding protein